MDNNIDKKIRQALSGRDAEVFDEFSEPQSLLAQALDLMKGRNRWINAYVILVAVVFMGVAIYCLLQFIAAEETKALMGWALGLMFSLSAVSMIKLWAWMEMEKNSTIREIKRLELQVAYLSQKLDAK